MSPSFFFNAHNDFLQEVAKFRAARRLWARVMRSDSAPRIRGRSRCASSADRRLDATAQQPELNIVRVAIQALAAVCGGAQSLHTTRSTRRWRR